MQLAAAAVALYALSPKSRLYQVLVGCLPLIRNELVIPLLAIIVFTWLTSRKLPKFLIVSSLLLGGCYLAFRIAYFSDFFTAPYYLKDKVAFNQGLYYVLNCVKPYGTLWALVIAGLMLVMNRRLRDPDIQLRSQALMWVTAASAVPYVVKIGGDMMHYRLLAFPFCLIILSLGGVAERWLSFAVKNRSSIIRFSLGMTIGVTLVVQYPWFLSSHPFWGKDERKMDQGISDASYHRHSPPLAFTSSRKKEDEVRLQRYHDMKEETPDYRVECWCQTMFEDFAHKYVHFCGLTEPILARVDVPEQRPGHKAGLLPLAHDLALIRTRYRNPGIGVADRAIRDGLAPRWIVVNQSKVRMVEARMYNSHNLLANIAQALRPVGTITLGSSQASLH